MGGVLGTAGVSEASPNANFGPVYWRDKELPLDKLPRFSVFWEILWELYELNFHLELTSLDQCTNRDSVKEDPAIRVKHLWSCFPPSSDLPFVMIPYMNISLVANNWREWVSFILALVNMMSCWEGSKPEVFKYQLHHVKNFWKVWHWSWNAKRLIFICKHFTTTLAMLLSSHIAFCLLYDLTHVFSCFF